MIRLYADNSATTAAPTPKPASPIRLYSDAPTAPKPTAPAPAPQQSSPATPGAAKAAPMVERSVPSLPLPTKPSVPVKTAGPAYGASNITDQSGAALETVKNDTAQQSQLLADRVYPGFDPTKPTKLDQNNLTNGRMPLDVSAPIKKQLGGAYSDELDHKISLELSGSNNPSNLKIEPGRQGGLSAAHDQLENQLARHVVKGEMSLLDAQRALAKAKGYTLHEDLAPGQADPNAGKPLIEGPQLKPSSGPSAGQRALDAYPATLSTLADLQMDPASLHADPRKAILDYWNGIKDSATNFATSVKDELKTLKSRDTAGGVGGDLKTAAAGVNFALSPISSLFSAANDVPILGTFSKLLTLPFAFMGDAGHDTAKVLVDSLPVSPETRSKIVDGVGDIFALAGQFAVGAISEKGGTTSGELIKKYGVNDATAIVDKAAELAKQRTAIQGESTTEQASAPAAKTAPSSERVAPSKGVSAEASPVLPEVKGTGEMKTRGLAAGVEAKAVENKLTQGFGDLPEYQSVNIKEQATQAHDLMTKDYEQAKRIAMGTEAPPRDLLPESVFVAVEDRAIKEGDVNTLRDLATRSELANQATTMGQRLRTLAERNPDSPVAAIRDVANAREKAAIDRAKGKDLKTAKKETAKQIRAEIKKATPTRETWASFVQSLKC